MGSNPHSNGEIFSRSIRVFFEIIKEILITSFLINKMIKIIIIVNKIIYTKYFRLVNWKLTILFILYKSDYFFK